MNDWPLNSVSYSGTVPDIAANRNLSVRSYKRVPAPQSPGGITYNGTVPDIAKNENLLLRSYKRVPAPRGPGGRREGSRRDDENNPAAGALGGTWRGLKRPGVLQTLFVTIPGNDSDENVSFHRIPIVVRFYECKKIFPGKGRPHLPMKNIGLRVES